MPYTSQSLLPANNNNGLKSFDSLVGLISNYKDNFLTKQVEILPGLSYNQYDILKRICFASHLQFQSGPNDENGDPKYYYDLHTDRNNQVTKNIDLDTKDCYIKAETGGSMLKSWMLRREFMGFAKNTMFGMKLNELSVELPVWGSVVWKKVKDKDGRTDVEQVELMNIINDPCAKKLSDGLFVVRNLMTQDDLREKEDVYGKEKVDSIIASGRTVRKTQFMTTNSSSSNSNIFPESVDETTPYYEVYELWGYIPRNIYESSKTDSEDGFSVVKISDTSKTPGYADLPMVTEASDAKEISTNQDNVKKNESVYVMAVVYGVSGGTVDCKEQILYCREQTIEDFPFKEVHFSRRKGRWLGVGNIELLFDLMEKANEITNRFFSALRLALLNIYQTRDKNHVKNVLTDLLNGDVIVTKSELTSLPTEVRGVGDFNNEITRIERRADALCNSYEVVSGADLPSGTPFKLGAQQLASATKLFKFIQQNIGLFIEQVFNEWLLPDFAASLTEEHVLDLVDDVDDLKMYYAAKKKLMQYDVIKKYILDNNSMPDPGQLDLIGDLTKDQVAKGPKQIKIEKDYYANLKWTIKTVVTGENDAKKENLETMTSILQTVLANPAGLQDPRAMKLLDNIMEESGYSPLDINVINQTPTNPSLNPANQGGASVERSTGVAGGGAGPPSSQPVAAR